MTVSIALTVLLYSAALFAAVTLVVFIIFCGFKFSEYLFDLLVDLFGLLGEFFHLLVEKIHARFFPASFCKRQVDIAKFSLYLFFIVWRKRPSLDFNQLGDRFSKDVSTSYNKLVGPEPVSGDFWENLIHGERKDRFCRALTILDKARFNIRENFGNHSVNILVRFNSMIPQLIEYGMNSIEPVFEEK